MKKFLKPIFCFAIVLTLCFCSLGLAGCTEAATNATISREDALSYLYAAQTNHALANQYGIKLITNNTVIQEDATTTMLQEFEVFQHETLGRVMYSKSTNTYKEGNNTNSSSSEAILFYSSGVKYQAIFENGTLTDVEQTSYNVTENLSVMLYSALPSELEQIEKTEFVNGNYIITINDVNSTIPTAQKTTYTLNSKCELLNISITEAIYDEEYKGSDGLTYISSIDCIYNNTVSTTLATKINTYAAAAIAEINA